VFDEANLLFRHATALQINRDAGEMRRGGVAIGGAALRLRRRSFFCTLTVRTAEFTWICAWNWL
jgi:hypothetical protein